MLQIGEKAAPLSSPLDHLIACHRRIEERLSTLERAGEELSTRPAEALDAIRSAMQFMETNGLRHTQDEEESLFPRLLPHLSSDERAFVTTLETEHEQADRIYEELKRTAALLPESADHYVRLAGELRALYGGHIRAEEETLIGLARRLLTATDIQAIAGEMSMRRAEQDC